MHAGAGGHGRRGAARLACGGDRLNTTLYLARLGLAPCYLSALGTDPSPDEMLAAWSAEGVRTHLVTRTAGRLPGLYAIRTSPAGERSFYYWRGETAARALLRSSACEAALAAGPHGEDHIPACTPRHILDTKGAGDAFNAGYLGMRMRGGSEHEAARFAHALAAVVVEHPGAIVPPEATAGLAARCFSTAPET